MSSTAPSPAQRSTQLLRRIFSAYQKRQLLPGGAAREKMDAHLSRLLQELSELVARPVQFHLDEPPPRTVALPFAMALQSHALLSIFFSNESAEQHSMGPPDPPILLHSEHVQKALGLQDWELTELREEVDRCVADRLRQERALDWIWAHFKLPGGDHGALFELLFPSTPAHISASTFVRSGRQLYAIVKSPSITEQHNLYVLGQPNSDVLHFEGRYVDLNLRNALSRSLGTTDAETVQLLNTLITAIPERDASAFITHDTWRVRGFAGITQLGGLYPSEPSALSPESVNCDAWLHFDATADAPNRYKIAFDRLALDRVESSLRAVYADLLACRAEAPPANTLRVEELHQFDTQRLLKQALSPLIVWAESAHTANWIAAQRQAPVERCAAELKRVASAWRAQMIAGWTGAPQENHPRSVACLLCVHLCQLRSSLNQLLNEPNAGGPKLRDMLFLFSGYYLNEAPLQRLWSDGLSEVGAPSHDVFADLFIATWNRLFLGDDEDADTFSGAFTLEF